MSYQRFIKAINLQLGDSVAEFNQLDHPGFMAKVIGWDPWANPRQAYLETFKALDSDWVSGIPNPTLAQDAFEHASSIEVADGARMTEWGLSGSYWQEKFHFETVDDVLAYDPLVNEPHVGLVAAKSKPQWYQGILDQQREVGEAHLISGCHYTTLFQCGIMVFGWPLFLTAAAAAPERFQRVLEGFAELSRRSLAEYAAFSPPFVLIHDDIAMTRGMVFNPDWYRQRLFPLYERILAPLFANPSIHVCFVSDGDYTAVLADLVALGFHGFLINSPDMNLAEIARLYGRDHFLAGSVDTAVLTFGDEDDVRREVARCVEEAKPCAGHIIHAMGDLPHNIPLANIRTYFEAIDRYRT